MPYSTTEARSIVTRWIEELSPDRVVDIGPGAGAYAKLCDASDATPVVDAVEIWEPYVERFGLKDLYANVLVADGFDLGASHFVGYQLAILGDVIEHVDKGRAVGVFETLREAGVQHAICVVPIVHYPQDEHEGNPYEVHVKDDWSHAEFFEAMSNHTIRAFRIYPTVGAYLVGL